MSSELVLYEEKYALEKYELLFMQNFTMTHSLSESLKLLTDRQKERVSGSLRAGKSNLALAYKSFIESAPIHPEANRAVILDNLVWAMNQSREDNDTGGMIKAISEINKMIKGNLVASADKKIIQTKFIGLIDLTKKNILEDEETIIDVTPNK